MKAKLHLVLSITIFFSWFYGFSQNEYWKPVISSTQATVSDTINKNLEFELNNTLFNKALFADAQTVYFPNMKGNLESFKIQEKAIFHPDLSAKYPHIKSFVGWNKARDRKVVFSISHHGLQVMFVDHAKGESVFIEKVSKGKKPYKVFKNSLHKSSFECKTEDLKRAQNKTKKGILIDDQTLRTFRIAVSATGEYTAYHGGATSDALAAINATLTRINEVFETDLGVRLELIANNDRVIYTDPSTDPYTNSLNAQVQNVLTTRIGENNYDVGHLFHRDNDNGNAGFIGSVCANNRKGSAFSSALVPEGDAFDLDYVAHELGHQFGANHTWSFESENTGVQAEPASGTTIMGYAGIVDGNNVAGNGDDYFHHNSIVQIASFLQTTSCAVTTSLSNEPPIITPIGNFKIPKGTPFVLSGNASDADSNDVLTFTWEQVDDGVVTTTTFGPDNVVGANFRSLPPSTSSDRYFPRLSRVVNNQLEQSNPDINDAWETISNIERDLNFALTVRDNSSEVGQTSSDMVTVSVVNDAGPFVVTSQNASEVYDAGSIQEVTWEVANTNGTEINTTLVDIYVSIDGGFNFPFLVADDIPNNGSAQIQIPGEATNSARIMVKASDNVFFALNTVDFTISSSAVVLNFDNLVFEVCTPDNLQIPFTFETFNGFAETVSFSANVPDGLTSIFSPIQASANATPVTLDITNIASLDSGAYPIEIIATAPSFSSSTSITLSVFENNFETVTLTSPLNEATATFVNPDFSWIEDENAKQYEIQIASDDLFTTIVETAVVTFATFESSNLASETTYFWRVRPINDCGQGVFSPAFTFTTSVIDCKAFDTDEQPVEIVVETPSTITSKISFVEDLRVSDINVNLEVSHTYLEDLIISLTSPLGSTVVLTSKSCGSLNNMNVIFDDDGVPINCSGNPALEGTIRPLGSLSSFNGESLLGDWILTIEDTAASDGGALESFSLDVCVEGLFRPDEDEDGVFDDGDDLCLGTPKGIKVDTSGCPLNDFAQNNFNIAIQSESCITNNDGSIQIEVVDTAINYTASLSGNGVDLIVDFTNNHSFQGLSSGIYTLCVDGSDEAITYRAQCFEVVIVEPQILEVLTEILPDSQSLQIDLSGSEFYTVEVNGVAVQTIENTITVDLINGNNTLKVFTSLPCQGVYEEQIIVAEKPILFPNPVDEYVTIQVNGNDQKAFFEVFALNGQLIFSKTYEQKGKELNVNLSYLPNGLYYAVLTSNNVRYTYKVIKR